MPFTHEQLDEQRPLLLDQDAIPLVEASSERQPNSFPVLEQWRDSRRRLAVHGANRDPRWLGASREQEVWARSYSYNGQAQRDLLWALNTTVRQYGKLTSHIWSLTTDGPNRLPNYGGYMVFGEDCLNHIFAWDRWGCQYDPTNGTVSAGDIVRVGP